MNNKSKWTLSRRDILKKGPVAIAWGVLASITLSTPIISRIGRDHHIPDLPKDSIFTPSSTPPKRS
ncbi:MAG: hypothetical protein QGF12_05435 [SAR202 cluster bacterium]|nr:hypothetical protein [SAR202 cluster bacterium]